VATSGSPDASGKVQQAGMRDGVVVRSGKSFADYFWETFTRDGGRLPSASDHLCFAFELMGPLNRIVVVHERASLQLLAVRDRMTGEQYLPEAYVDLVGVHAVRSFPLTNLAEVRASFDHISPVSQEGYVVVDGSFNRVKIKHPGYVALHHAKDGMGPRAFVEIARTGELSEVAATFPEFRPLIEEARVRYRSFVDAVKTSYASIGHVKAQKDFASLALKTPYSAALFQMRKGVELEVFLREVPVDKLMAWMGVASEESRS
jgi:hypothetical protein